MKNIFYMILIVIIVMGIVSYLTRKPPEPIVITQTETKIVLDTIYVEKTLPAIIEYVTVWDTLYQEVVIDTVATIIIDVEEENIYGTIAIAYSYKYKKFDVQLNLISESYIETVTHYIQKPYVPKFISPVAYSGYYNNEFFSLGAGIILTEKFAVIPSFTTSGGYGINIIYRF